MRKGIYISPGNIRMSFPTFSLPAISTCPGSTNLCRKYCYARKAEITWKNPLESRTRNYIASERDDFVDEMIKIMPKSPYIRVHESGDMYNQEYLDKWIAIANHFKDKTFLVYSQMYDLDWSKKPDNMILYWTVWPDTVDYPKDGLHAYVIDNGNGKIPQYNLPKTKICTKGKRSKLKCEDCMWCYKARGDITFELH